MSKIGIEIKNLRTERDQTGRQKGACGRIRSRGQCGLRRRVQQGAARVDCNVGIGSQRSGRALIVTYYDFAAKKSQPVVRFKNMNMFDGYSISPDGRQVLYSKVDQNETNLAMVENFR